MATMNTRLTAAPGPAGPAGAPGGSDAAFAGFVGDTASATRVALDTAVADNLPRLLATNYGVVADGTTNNTTALAAAVADLPAGGGCIELPAGTVVGTIVLPSDAMLVGQGVGATILKAPASTSGGVVKSLGYATYSGSATASPETRGAHRIQLANLTIDGNKTSAASSVGIQVYGAGWRWSHVRVQNCGSDGIQTEFGQDVNFTTFNALEGHAENIVSCGHGGHGWRFRGPHDANIGNYIAHSNTGWGFRNESSAGFYNGTLGHCSRFNLFLNTAGGWYVGTGVASYMGGQIAGDSGTGMEFAAGIGGIVMQGLLLSGWTTAAIIRGSNHNLDLVVQTSGTGIKVDGLSGTSIRATGQGNDTAVLLTDEDGPNMFQGIFDVPTGKTLVSGTPNTGSMVSIVQLGNAGNSRVWQMPGVFTLPSGTEVSTDRMLSSTGKVVAARNTANQVQVGEFVGLNGGHGMFMGPDTSVERVAANTVNIGKLAVSNAAAATTPGSVVKKIQVYDQAGASLGYVAVYSAIT